MQHRLREAGLGCRWQAWILVAGLGRGTFGVLMF
jgi:hypothetical protein